MLTYSMGKGECKFRDLSMQEGNVGFGDSYPGAQLSWRRRKERDLIVVKTVAV